MLRKLDGTVVHSVLRKPFDIDELGDLIAAVAKTMHDEREGRDGNVLSFPQMQR
jgi:hypothetical protein